MVHYIVTKITTHKFNIIAETAEAALRQVQQDSDDKVADETQVTVTVSFDGLVEECQKES